MKATSILLVGILALCTQLQLAATATEYMGECGGPRGAAERGWHRLGSHTRLRAGRAGSTIVVVQSPQQAGARHCLWAPQP